jgi:hypothetical protein
MYMMNVQVTAEEEELLLRSPRSTKRKERRAKLKKRFEELFGPEDGDKEYEPRKKSVKERRGGVSGSRIEKKEIGGDPIDLENSKRKEGSEVDKVHGDERRRRRKEERVLARISRNLGKMAEACLQKRGVGAVNPIDLEVIKAEKNPVDVEVMEVEKNPVDVEFMEVEKNLVEVERNLVDVEVMEVEHLGEPVSYGPWKLLPIDCARETACVGTQTDPSSFPLMFGFPSIPKECPKLSEEEKAQQRQRTANLAARGRREQRIQTPQGSVLKSVSDRIRNRVLYQARTLDA